MPSHSNTALRTGNTTAHPQEGTSSPHAVLFISCSGVPVFLSDEDRRGFCRGVCLVAALATSIAAVAVAVLWATDRLPL